MRRSRSSPGRAGDPVTRVRGWHLAVAWLVAGVIAAIGVFLLAGGLVGLVGQSNVVAGTLLAGGGLLVIWGDLTYARSIIRTHRGVANASGGSADEAGRPQPR